MRLGISTKLWITLIILLLGSSLFTYWTTLIIYKHFYVAQTEEQLSEQGSKLSALYQGGPITPELKDKVILMNSISNEEIKLADNLAILGECLPINHKDPYLQLLREKLFNGEVITVVGEHAQCEKDIIAVATPLMDPSTNQLVGAIFVFRKLATIYDAISEIKFMLFMYIFLFILLGIIVGKLITNKLTRRIRQMESVATKMMDGDFNAKLVDHSKDEIGKLGQTINHLSDSLKTTIQLLSKEKKQLSQILDGIRDGVITVDKDGGLVKCNCSSRNLLDKLGISKEDFLLLPIIKQNFDKVLKQKEIIVDETELGEFVFILYLAPLIEKDELWGTAIVIHDITLERKRERDIREFLAMVSHELRTPLSYMKGYTEALIDGIAGTKEVEDRYITTIDNETKRMERLVNDLLDLTKLENAAYTMNNDQIHLDHIVDKVVTRFKKAYGNKGVVLNFQNIGDNELRMIGDEDRIIQILVNLFDNALRHTPVDGEVAVKTYLKDKYVVVEISDTGEGIEKKHLDKIGQKFYRIDKARSRQHGGTGLGLAIVKQIVDKLKGKLEIESVVGEGTTFKITFPSI